MNSRIRPAGMALAISVVCAMSVSLLLLGKSAAQETTASLAQKYFDSLQNSFPVGVLYRRADGSYEGAFRWATFAGDDFSVRYPESVMTATLSSNAQALYVYCVGRRNNDGISTSRSNPATECVDIGSEDRRELEGLLGLADDPARPLLTVGQARFEGHNALYYSSAEFANGGGAVFQTKQSGLMIADVSLLHQKVVDRKPVAYYKNYLLAVAESLPDLQPPRLNRGTEGNGCYRAFDDLTAFYTELTLPRYSVTTLSELHRRGPDQDKVNVVIRHDLDLSIYGARQIGALEAFYGLKSNYFVNFGSSLSALVASNGRYTPNPALQNNLQALKELGHEIGFHGDLLYFQLFYDFDPLSWSNLILSTYRAAGFAFNTSSQNGSPHAWATDSVNLLLYKDYRDGGKYAGKVPWASNRNGSNGKLKLERDGVTREVELPQLTMSDIGIEYDVVSGFTHFDHSPFRHYAFDDGDTKRDAFAQKMRTFKKGSVVISLLHPVDWIECNVDADIYFDMDFRSRVGPDFGRIQWPIFSDTAGVISSK